MIPEPRVQFLPGDCIPLDTIDPRTNRSQLTLAAEEGGSRTFDHVQRVWNWPLRSDFRHIRFGEWYLSIKRLDAPMQLGNVAPQPLRFMQRLCG